MEQGSKNCGFLGTVGQRQYWSPHCLPEDNDTLSQALTKVEGNFSDMPLDSRLSTKDIW